MSVRSVAYVFVALTALTSCRSHRSDAEQLHRTTLRDYALKARELGAREALVPYAFDEEEGDNLIVPSLDGALDRYEWVVGEPIEERTIAVSEHESAAPDSIFTMYRFRVEQRVGRSNNRLPDGRLDRELLRMMPLRKDEVLVMKSGGNIVIEGVLLKKHGTSCFSELLPRRYLLGLTTSSSGQIGWMNMGCRSIFMVDGDRLTPRQTLPEPVTQGVAEQLGSSLSAFTNAVRKVQQQ